jgi:hypothetical protein
MQFASSHVCSVCDLPRLIWTDGRRECRDLRSQGRVISRPRNEQFSSAAAPQGEESASTSNGTTANVLAPKRKERWKNIWDPILNALSSAIDLLDFLSTENGNSRDPKVESKFFDRRLRFPIKEEMVRLLPIVVRDAGTTLN